MKENFKVALFQFDPILGDIKRNIDRHIEFLEKDEVKDSDICVFPELSLTGYLLQDLVGEVAIPLYKSKILEPLIKISKKKDLVFGFVEQSRDFLYYNSALYLSNGEITHLHRKVYLPTYGMFDEGRYFASGNKFSAFETRFGKVGIMICEDAWHLTSSFILTMQGAHTLFILSSSPGRGWSGGGPVASVQTWERVGQVISQFLTVNWVYANRVGYEDGLAFAGGSYISDPFGNLILKGKGNEPGIYSAEITLIDIRRARTISPLLRDEKIHLLKSHIEEIIRRQNG